MNNPGGTVSAATQVWRELSTSLRQVRGQADMSLRTVEKMTGWGRGSLSQIENGKARPTRAQVEWYDLKFGGDGVLVAMFAEARGAHGPVGRGPFDAAPSAGDSVEVVDVLTPLGDVVETGATVPVGWTLHNTGTVPWRARRLHRVGPQAVPGLIGGPATVDLPDCEPGDRVSVRFDITMPAVPATLAAFWEIADDEGRPCYPVAVLLKVVLVARDSG